MSPKVTSLSTDADFSIFDDDLKPKVQNLGSYKHQSFFSYGLIIPTTTPREFDRNISYMLEQSKLNLRAGFIT